MDWQKAYGHRAVKADKSLCGESVYSQSRWNGSHQCFNKAVTDLNEDGLPTRCNVHSEAAQAKRDAKAKARYDAARAQRVRAALAGPAKPLVVALQAIRDGDNNPRETAREALAALGL